MHEYIGREFGKPGRMGLNGYREILEIEAGKVDRVRPKLVNDVPVELAAPVALFRRRVVHMLPELDRIRGSEFAGGDAAFRVGEEAHVAVLRIHPQPELFLRRQRNDLIRLRDIAHERLFAEYMNASTKGSRTNIEMRRRRCSNDQDLWLRFGQQRIDVGERILDRKLAGDLGSNGGIWIGRADHFNLRNRAAGGQMDSARNAPESGERHSYFHRHSSIIFR